MRGGSLLGRAVRAVRQREVASVALFSAAVLTDAVAGWVVAQVAVLAVAVAALADLLVGLVFVLVLGLGPVVH